jgi:hypothetical protein
MQLHVRVRHLVERVFRVLLLDLLQNLIEVVGLIGLSR